jgi:hypothetical protein
LKTYSFRMAFNSGLKCCLSQRNPCSMKVSRYPARHFALEGSKDVVLHTCRATSASWEYSNALPLPRNPPQVNAGYMDRCRMCSALSAILIGAGEKKSFGLCPEIIAASPFHSEFRIQAGNPASVPLQCLRRMFIYGHNFMHIEQNFPRNPEITIRSTSRQGLKLLKTPSCIHHCFLFEKPCHLPQQL